MTVVDPVAAIRTVLLADGGVAALVETRVYGGEVPEKDTNKMGRACVVVNASGGMGMSGGEGYLELGKQRIDTICYGSTLNEAFTVYCAVHRALKQMHRRVASGVLLHSAEPVSKGVTARDPVTTWPTTLASWSVLASEVAAA